MPSHAARRKWTMPLRPMTLRICALAIAAASVGAAFAQSPCGNVRPDESRPGLAYAQRSDSLRCEGFYVASDSSGGLDLLSLTWGKLDFGATSRMLEIRLDSATSQTSRVAIRGRGLPDDLHYWMAGDFRNGPFRLRLSDVIQPAGILPSEIGFVASRASPIGERINMPARILVDGRPLQDDDTLHVVVRPQSDIRNFSWRLQTPGEPPQGTDPAHSRALVRAGIPVQIAFKPPAQASMFDLDVIYQGLSDSKPMTIPIHISTAF